MRRSKRSDVLTSVAEGTLEGPAALVLLESAFPAVPRERIAICHRKSTKPKWAGGIDAGSTREGFRRPVLPVGKVRPGSTDTGLETNAAGTAARARAVLQGRLAQAKAPKSATAAKRSERRRGALETSRERHPGPVVESRFPKPLKRRSGTKWRRTMQTTGRSRSGGPGHVESRVPAWARRVLHFAFSTGSKPGPVGLGPCERVSSNPGHRSTAEREVHR